MDTTELTFHSFPKLPPEIRVMIWRFAVQGSPSREVMLRYDDRPELLWVLPEISSCAKVPPLLHTCHVSRTLSLERWKLSLAATETSEKKVYLDPMTDKLCFPDRELLGLWHIARDRAEINFLAAGDNVYLVDWDGKTLIHFNLPAYLPHR